MQVILVVLKRDSFYWHTCENQNRKALNPTQKAVIPLESSPNRQPDFSHPEGWIEGAEWIYAGASPIVPGNCSCPSSRFHLDWYKRVYVPEAYRHSIGILDTNGDLIMHLGRYGNFDNATGGKDGYKPGSEDICFIAPRYIRWY